MSPDREVTHRRIVARVKDDIDNGYDEELMLRDVTAKLREHGFLPPGGVVDGFHVTDGVLYVNATAPAPPASPWIQVIVTVQP